MRFPFVVLSRREYDALHAEVTEARSWQARYGWASADPVKARMSLDQKSRQVTAAVSEFADMVVDLREHARLLAKATAAEADHGE